MNNKSQLLQRITIDPNILVGKPTIRGMRLSVQQILNALAAGLTFNDLKKDYPMLEQEDIAACLYYAEDVIEHEKVYNVNP